MINTKLVTKEIEKKLKPLYTYEDTPLEEVKVPLKLFNPYGRGTWYIWEWDGKDLMFGIANIFEKEIGYVSLKELQNVDCGFSLGVERDILWSGKKTAQEILSNDRY